MTSTRFFARKTFIGIYIYSKTIEIANQTDKTRGKDPYTLSKQSASADKVE